MVGLAKTANVFGIPTVLTTVLEERGGVLIQQLQDVFPDQKAINRTFINAWEDQRVVAAVGATGRKKLIIAGVALGRRRPHSWSSERVCCTARHARLGRPTEAPLGRTRYLRCIGTTCARARELPIGGSCSTSLSQ